MCLPLPRLMKVYHANSEYAAWYCTNENAPHKAGRSGSSRLE
jgi:hypothetical protein